MPRFTRRAFLPMLAAAPTLVRALADDSAQEIALFDGRSLAGWKATDNADSFRVADGQIVAEGPRARLFYDSPVHGAQFKNFALTVEAMLRGGGQSAIGFHTTPHAAGGAETGLAVLLANDASGPGDFVERRKTGSLVGLRNVYKQFVKDGEWFQLQIVVRQKQVEVRLNDMLVVDYVEPEPPFVADVAHPRTLGHGTFAIEAHGPEGAAWFRNLRVRPLGDDVPQFSPDKPQVDEVYRQIVRLSNTNIPLVDSHTHLKGGLTLEQALANSRRVGIFYGIAINCGLGFPVHDDESVRAYLDTMKGQPCYVALQCEGREWRSLVTPETVSRFDYMFTDAMTFSDNNGKRMRIWIPEEVGVIDDRQAFMEMLVDRIEHILREPIDIYANATYIPDQMAGDYDALWTPRRMQRVIDAALANDVAIEINNRRRIPSPRFLKLAKAAGCKFSFGTNNAEAELGRLEYPMAMVKECGLTWQDIFVPRPDGKKPIQLRG